MKTPTRDEFYFRTGVVASDDRIILLAGHRELDEQEVGNTFIFGWRGPGNWTGMTANWSSSSICFAGDPDPRPVMLGPGSEYLSWSAGGERREGVVRAPGVGRHVCAIGGRVFAFGALGLAARLESDWSWTELAGERFGGVDFENAAGASAEEFIAVGEKGAIVRFSNGAPSAIDSPTNVFLASVCCSDEGIYYACGANGMLLQGGGDFWNVIDHGVTTEHFWSTAWFQGALYVASSTFVYRLNGQTLERVVLGEGAPLSAYHLHALGNRYLLSVGRDDVRLYDGDMWTVII